MYIFRGRLQVSVLLWWGLWRLMDFISFIFREAYLRRCLCSALSMLAFFDWIIMNRIFLLALAYSRKINWIMNNSEGW